MASPTADPPIASSSTPIQTQTPSIEPFKVYKPPTASSTSPTPLPALPDEYFTPTMSDLKAAQATLSARTNQLVNAPLQLRAVRDAAEKSKRDRWPETKIRVKFPDQTQLEKTFPSTDKIRSVYAFVRHCLNDQAKPIKFILYQSPPKRDLKVSDAKVRDLSLAELQLAPSSILLLRFEDEALNHDQVQAPLLPSILEQAIDIPVPAPSPPPTKQILPSSQSSSTAPALNTTGSAGKDKKIPKWLKLGKK